MEADLATCHLSLLHAVAAVQGLREEGMVVPAALAPSVYVESTAADEKGEDLFRSPSMRRPRRQIDLLIPTVESDVQSFSGAPILTCL